MIRNYIKVAIRNILKHRFYAVLNILGLSVGIAAVLFIGMYVSDELSYDRFHYDVQNLYRIGLHGRIGEREINTSSSAAPVAGALLRNVPGVTAVTRVWPRYSRPIRYKDYAITMEKVFMADSNFFSFFSFPLIEGDPATALKEPNTIVLSEVTAKQFFGDDPAVGKLVTMGEDNQTFKVTGVAGKVPRNSHIQFSLLISFSTSPMMESTKWLNNTLFTYYRKNPEVNAVTIDAELAKLTAEHAGSELESAMGINLQEFLKNGGIYSYYSYPITDTHLYMKDLQDEVITQSDIKYVYILSAIGIFIMIIACINFMNLATARSSGRAKEVGLRKTLGSSRSVLIYQFLGESFIYVTASLLIALVLVLLLMPFFNTLAGKEFVAADLWQPNLVSGMVTLVVVVGFLAGSYPAFYLTSFKVADVLKGKLRKGTGGKQIRSTLVVFQFSVSIFLIICTAVVFQQLNYLKNKDIGIDRDQILVINNLGTQSRSFKQTMLSQSTVVAASFSSTIFPGANNTTVFREKGKEVDHLASTVSVDNDFQDVLKYKILEGRNFSRDFVSDSATIVINEAAAKEFGWTNQEAVGKDISFTGEGQQIRRVIGVMKDFNFDNFRVQIRPLLLELQPEDAGSLHIRYTGDAQAIVNLATQEWKKIKVGDPLNYTFLDEEFNNVFKEDQRLSAIFNVFTALAIFVSCLGLFGLAAFTAEQRTKEIGIRKVMGASVFQLSSSLSWEFMILVGIGFVIAVLPAWYFLNSWLNGFAFHIAPSVLVFLLGGITSALVAAITVNVQAVKAARGNPVDALRCE